MKHIRGGPESVDVYREMVECVNSIIIRWNMDFKITFINDFALGFFGYEEGELLGKSLMGTIVPESGSMGENLARMILDISRNPERYVTNVNENVRKGGEKVWISWTNKAIFHGEGQVKEILSVGNDITERVKAEQSLKVAKMQAELYLDLMGHDINNMHQVALGYLELARDMDGEGRGKFLDKPMEVLRRSNRLIQNVQKLQKLRDGVFRTGRVDLAVVLREVLSQYDRMHDKAIALDLKGGGPYTVMANELLHDVFANIVDNAIKHANGDTPDIRISLDTVGDNGLRYHRVAVEDKGPGISDDLKDKVFNRMLRGTTRAKGMGLGLYLVKSLVDSYDSRVWVEDRVPGDHTKGARFIVMLPAVESPA